MKKSFWVLSLCTMMALMIQLPLAAAYASGNGDFTILKREAFQQEVNGKMADLYRQIVAACSKRRVNEFSLLPF